MNHPVRLTSLIVLTGCLLACTGNEAREDLDAENQRNDDSLAVIGVSPDGFPNVAHKCMVFEETGLVVGYWTTTDRSVLLLYNDHACATSNKEQPQEIVSMIPRSMVSASGG